MKQKTMQELNEQYKDCPQRENEYTVCGQKMIVVSHFIGDKDLDDADCEKMLGDNEQEQDKQAV